MYHELKRTFYYHLNCNEKEHITMTAQIEQLRSQNQQLAAVIDNAFRRIRDHQHILEEYLLNDIIIELGCEDD